MKVERIVLFVMFFLCSYGLFAQTEMNIKITDSAGSPLPYAQIAYFPRNDTTALKYAVADSTGIIHVIVKQLPVSIKAEYIGYKPKEIVCNTTNSLNIKLEDDILSLKGVTIIASRPKIKMSKEGIVANIQGTALGKLG